MLPGGRDGRQPRRIMVLRLGNVGDIIVAIPAFHVLRRMFPEAHMTLLTSPTNRGAPGAMEVLANDKTFDETIVYYADESNRLDFIRGLRKRIAASGIDLVVALPNQLTGVPNLAKFLPLFAAAGVRRFAGFRLVTPGDYNIRQVDRLVNLVRELGPAEVEPFPWLIPSVADGRRADELLAIVSGKALIGMHCGAKRPANRWSPDSFAAVGRQLADRHGVRIVLTGSGGEKELVDRVATTLGSSCVNLAGKTSLGELAAVARRCRAFISNDTGVMHVAYAVGTPIMAIVSARYCPEIWYPYGERQEVIRKRIECEHCEADECPLYAYPKCLDMITVDEVIEASERLLSGRA